MTKQEVMEIIDLALEVNSLNVRKQGVSGSLPTAFIKFYGHVAELEVSVNENGWEDYERADRRFAFNTAEPLDQEQMTEYLQYTEELIKKVDPASEGSTGSDEE